MSRGRDLRLRFGGAAVITGASAGIGAAFARALAAAGMDLLLVARRADRLEALAGELSSKHGVRTAALAVDLAAGDAAERVCDALRARGLEAGLLVNNAGFGYFGPFAAQEGTSAGGMVNVMCRAPVLLTRALLPGMQARAKGGVVFVASTAAYQPTPTSAVYGAAKAFELSFGVALWAELRGSGIDVLVLSPGETATEFQAVSGFDLHSPGGSATADAVVETALRALGRTPAAIHGARNRLLALLAQLLPTSFVARMALRELGGRIQRR